MWRRESSRKGTTLILLLTFVWVVTVAHAKQGSSERSIQQPLCRSLPLHLPTKWSGAPAGPVAGLPIIAEADHIEASDSGQIDLLGHVEIQQGKRILHADVISYDRNTRQVDARGNVVLYTMVGDQLRAKSLGLQFDTLHGVAQHVSIHIAPTDADDPLPSISEATPPKDIQEQVPMKESDGETRRMMYPQARVWGETLQLQGRDRMMLTNAMMTTCPEGNADVMLMAGELILDHAKGVGTATDLAVQLKGVRVGSFPRITFPIGNQRQTGFLVPSVGEKSNSGIILEVPYYLNIAPHMDATITPQFLSDRGLLWSGEFRYLGEHTQGRLAADYLPSDDQYEDLERYAIQYDHTQHLGRRWHLETEIQDVSDRDYLRHFSDGREDYAASFVRKSVRLEQNGTWLNYYVRAQAHESVYDRIAVSDLPYRIIPEIGMDMRPRKWGVFEGGVGARMSWYTHSDETRAHGVRTLIQPYISIPLRSSFGSLEPKVSLYYMRYALDSFPQETFSEHIPIYSLDGKLVLDRLIAISDQTFYQTLEPRLFYVHIPEDGSQLNLPNFDTAESSPRRLFHFFREGRFLGSDRIGDTKQITLGLTTRVIEELTGVQRLRVGFGQIFYLQDRNIRLRPMDPSFTNPRSNFLMDWTVGINRYWNLNGLVQIEENWTQTEELWMSVDFDDHWRRRGTVAYFEATDQREQVNLAFSTPLSPNWQWQVDTAYSPDDGGFQSSAVHLDYFSCCWSAGMEYRHFDDEAGDDRNEIRFTVYLDSLGGSRSFFERRK